MDSSNGICSLQRRQYYASRTRAYAGANTTIRAGLKAVRLYGVCAESIWPYDIEKFDDRPSDEAYQDAKSRNIKVYQRLSATQDAVNALANNRPVLIAIYVFDEFMFLDKNNSVVPMPEQQLDSEGMGHAMCIEGYDLNRRMFLVKNSFGTEWGDNGYCWIPFDYVERYVFEQWVFDITNQ